MSKRSRVIIPLVVLAMVFGPVIIKQLMPAERRQYDYVSLAETSYSEIGFHNSRQDIALAGMLFVPRGEGPFPAVVVIHGSGTSRRDNGWYLTLTDYLQKNGIVVLLPDKRGSEKSAGDWRSADFHDLATDTLAAIDYLRAQDHVAISDVGIVGMSQGGWIAPLVASESDDVAFLVSLAGSTVTPAEQLQYEENLNLRQIGFLPIISNTLAAVSTAYIKHVSQSAFWDAVGDYDPLPLWRKLDIDALAMFGSDDTNVPSERSATKLNELRNTKIRVRIYEGSGHALADPVENGNDLIRYDVLEDISEFIESVT
jgi:dienelactone hydrolase